MLKIDRLSTSYKTIHGDVRVVNNLDFTINDNEIFGIAGESGCGKSTLLKALYDIIDFPMQVDSGRVILSGEKEGNPFHFETGEIRKTWWNNISYVPQAAQSVMNPITHLRNQFLDSIPESQRKNETKKQTLERCAAYLKELESLARPSGRVSVPAFRWNAAARDHCAGDVHVAECGSGGRADDGPGCGRSARHSDDADAAPAAAEEHAGAGQPRYGRSLSDHDRMGIMYSGSFVELGKTEDIFSDPIHPYTEMLIGALPRVGDKSQKAGIPGRPPALTNPPPGCRFAPRCPKAKEICHRECPEFVEVRPGRFAACHMLGKEGI